MSYRKYRTENAKGVDSQFNARVEIPPGHLITGPADVSLITYTVTEQLGAQAGTQTGTGNCPINACVFPVLQLGSGWTEDNTGFNFQFTVPGASFPDPGEYIVLFLFTPSGGGTPIPLEYSHHAADTG